MHEAKGWGGPRELGVGAIARMRQIHRSTARRWLKDIEAKYGADVVYRRRGRYYTTDTAIARFAPAGVDPKLAKTIADLTERVGEMERRQDAFQRQSRDWFTRRGAAEPARKTGVRPEGKGAAKSI
jgi:hypothetical protein